MKQFFQVLVIRQYAAHDDVVNLGEFEECLRGPVGGNLNAVIAPLIVVEDGHAFKAQILQKGVRIALNLQAVTIMPSAAEMLNGPLAQDRALGAK